MSEQKFKGTPGPWEWDIHDESMASLHGPDHGEDFVMSVSPCSNCIKDKAEWKFGRCMTPSLANARLIAAAPELLEALEVFIKYWSDEEGCSSPHYQDVLKARAAIAKAYGQ